MIVESHKDVASEVIGAPPSTSCIFFFTLFVVAESAALLFNIAREPLLFPNNAPTFVSSVNKVLVDAL